VAPAPADARSNLVSAFGNIVRQAQIPGIDVQRLSMAFRMTLDGMDPGQPIELQQLFDYLVNDQKVDEKAVVELCVILKSRESKLGVQLVPAKKTQLPYLTPEKAEAMIVAFQIRVDKNVGTWEKSGEISTVASSSSTGKTTPGQKAWRPSPGDVKKGKGPRSKTPIYVGALVVAILGAVAFFGWRQSTLEPEMKSIPVPTDLPGLKCTHITTNGPIAICDIPDALAASLTPDAMATQATMTKGALIGAGVSTLYVRNEAKQRIVFMK
jgi:hypothetical protein